MPARRDTVTCENPFSFLQAAMQWPMVLLFDTFAKSYSLSLIDVYRVYQ